MEALSKNRIDKAGDNLLVSPCDVDYEVVYEYRMRHWHLMNLLANTIAKKLPKPQVLARRIKRITSIKLKIRRLSTRLSSMQDIGGVRAIFKTDDEVSVFAERVRMAYSGKRCKLKIIKENNYIETPKPDGYRSCHIIFEYVGGKGDKEKYNGLKVELQLRTLAQHAWATAVEIMGVIDKDNELKQGRGAQAYRDFFRIANAVLHDTASASDIERILEINKNEHIIDRIQALRVVMERPPKATRLLLILNYPQKTLKVVPFNDSDLFSQKLYEEFDKDDAFDTVLVNLSDINKLKKAYPNYYLDASDFVNRLRRKIEELGETL